MSPIASPGSMNVDWEERWNVERLRAYRTTRARDALAASDLGGVLLFDFNNIRYVTSTHIGEWARDKMTRFALLTRGGEPHLWDFGSAAKQAGLELPVAQEMKSLLRATAEAGYADDDFMALYLRQRSASLDQEVVR